MLALNGLSNSAQAIMWFISLIAFILATFWAGWGPAQPAPTRWYVHLNLVALGLAVWALQQFWQATARS